MASESQLLFGACLRHLRTIGYLGQINKLYAIQATQLGHSGNLTLRNFGQVADTAQCIIERKMFARKTQRLQEET